MGETRSRLRTGDREFESLPVGQLNQGLKATKQSAPAFFYLIFFESSKISPVHAPSGFFVITGVDCVESRMATVCSAAAGSRYPVPFFDPSTSFAISPIIRF